jgi:hypothetical protein
MLDRFKLKGTFYASPTTLLDSIKRWRSTVGDGHEVGNGCLLSAAQEDGQLPNWTLEMISADIELSELLLDEVLPRQIGRSFGFPWGEPLCNDGLDYREIVEGLGLVGRSGMEGRNVPRSCNLSFLRSTPAIDLDGHNLIQMVNEAIGHGAWLILAFDGIGSGPSSIDASAHRALCEYLDEMRGSTYVDTVSRVATCVRERAGAIYHSI